MRGHGKGAEDRNFLNRKIGKDGKKYILNRKSPKGAKVGGTFAPFGLFLFNHSSRSSRPSCSKIRSLAAFRFRRPVLACAPPAVHSLREMKSHAAATRALRRRLGAR